MFAVAKVRGGTDEKGESTVIGRGVKGIRLLIREGLANRGQVGKRYRAIARRL
jgi:hypothetical protein